MVTLVLLQSLKEEPAPPPPPLRELGILETESTQKKILVGLVKKKGAKVYWLPAMVWVTHKFKCQNIKSFSSDTFRTLPLLCSYKQ